MADTELPPAIPDIPVVINDTLDQKIANAFLLFDEQEEKTVENSHIGTILRGLGMFPSNNDVHTCVQKMSIKEIPDQIHLGKFLPYVRNLINTKQFMPLKAPELMEKFKRLDEEEHGYLNKEYFIKLMTEHGDPMNPTELKEMLSRACDLRTGRIEYEFYINQLLFQPKPQDDVYIMADIIEAERPKPVKKKLSKFL